MQSQSNAWPTCHSSLLLRFVAQALQHAAPALSHCMPVSQLNSHTALHRHYCHGVTHAKSPAYMLSLH